MRERYVVNLKYPWEKYSANQADYFLKPKGHHFGKNYALAEIRPIKGKNVIGGYRLVIIKRNPTIADLGKKKLKKVI